MKKNMSILDKLIRMILALVISVLYFSHIVTGVAAMVLGVIGIIFMITSYINYCPLYAALGWSSRKHEV